MLKFAVNPDKSVSENQLHLPGISRAPRLLSISSTSFKPAISHSNATAPQSIHAKPLFTSLPVSKNNHRLTSRLRNSSFNIHILHSKPHRSSRPTSIPHTNPHFTSRYTDLKTSIVQTRTTINACCKHDNQSTSCTVQTTNTYPILDFLHSVAQHSTLTHTCDHTTQSNSYPTWHLNETNQNKCT